ncbi:MAG: hypothetical protein IJD51_06255 [Clostridia bacterium]|nr:hypothetical protein [Clostridia bacterium]
MRRLFALLLSAVLFFTVNSSLVSCVQDTPPEGGITATPDGDNGPAETVVVPSLRDYSDRRTVKFSEIEYKRPDIAALSDRMRECAELIREGGDFDACISLIDGLNAPYEELLTMRSYASIMSSRDRRNAYWLGEDAYISENFPTFSASLEKLFVACAQSEDALRYESEYFGEGLIEEYADGGVMDGELVALLERESALENEYDSLSGATVTITYKSFTDTYDNIIAHYKEHYGESSQSYKNALDKCSRLLDKAISERTVEIYVELVRLRGMIRTKLGYTGYMEYAYESCGHDYTRTDALEFIKDISDTVLPLYVNLDYYVFQKYFNTHDAPPLDRTALINGLYGALESMDPTLHDAYSYMLQFELYSIEDAKDGREEVSFSTYLHSFDAPYLFVTQTGDTDDYATLAHEFGHFADSFINGGDDASLDLMEVSSTALEYLALDGLFADLSDEEAKYLLYSTLRSSLVSIIFQGFYSLFEHYAYEIPTKDVSEKTLTDAMMRAARDMGLNEGAFQKNEAAGIYSPLDCVLIPHLIRVPAYVLSYCTSESVALEIFMSELECDGKGLEAYMELITRDVDGELSFEEELALAKLPSPFEDGFLAELAARIHSQLMGNYQYKNAA